MDIVRAGLARRRAGEIRKMANVSGAVAPQAKAGAVKEVTTASFRADVLSASTRQPVLVDFWAPWCAPCRAMAPSYAQAAQRLEPKFRVAKLNTEQAQELAARYAIRSIPTLALFKHGQEVARQPGAMNESGILAWAQAHA